jgi:hypothetical protein
MDAADAPRANSLKRLFSAPVSASWFRYAAISQRYD